MQRYWKVTNFEDIVFEWLVYACHNCHILLIETTKYAPLIPCSHRGRPTFGAYNTFVLYTVQPTVTRNRSSPWESPEETLMAWTNTELASPPPPMVPESPAPRGFKHFVYNVLHSDKTTVPQTIHRSQEQTLLAWTNTHGACSSISCPQGFNSWFLYILKIAQLCASNLCVALRAMLSAQSISWCSVYNFPYLGFWGILYLLDWPILKGFSS